MNAIQCFILALLASGILSGIKPAHAGMSVGFQGATLFKTNRPVLDVADEETTVTAEYGSQIGVGALLEYRFNSRKNWSLETGAYYTFQTLSYTATDGVSESSDDLTIQTVRIPLTLRWLRIKFIHFGLGGYYDLNLSGFANDFGVTGNVRLQVPLGKKLALVNEARVSQGLVSFGNTQNQELLVGLGLRFGNLD
jgi:hypothetical protein